MSMIKVIVTRAATEDKAFLIFVDTDFEPDGSDDSPGLRVLLNDDDIYTGTARNDTALTALQNARSEELVVDTDNLVYLDSPQEHPHDHGDYSDVQ